MDKFNESQGECGLLECLMYVIEYILGIQVLYQLLRLFIYLISYYLSIQTFLHLLQCIFVLITAKSTIVGTAGHS